MVRPQAIIDHTTLFKRKLWANRADGRSTADPLAEISSLTATERRLVTAFKQALGDHKAHNLSKLMLQADIKSLTAELKLPHTKVRHILKNVPKEIWVFDCPKTGNTFLALKPPSQDQGTSAHNEQAGASNQNNRRLSATAPQSEPLFRTKSPPSEHDSTLSDGGTDRATNRAVKSKSSEKAAKRASDSTWGMQRPQERQKHTKEVASATVSPAKKFASAPPKPRQSAPIASTSAGIQRSPIASTSAGIQRSPNASTSAGIQRSPNASTSAGVQWSPIASTSAGIQRSPIASTLAGIQQSPIASTSADNQRSPIASTSAGIQRSPIASTSPGIQRSTPSEIRQGNTATATDVEDDEGDLVRAIRQSISAAPPSQSQQPGAAPPAQSPQPEEFPIPLPLRKQPAPPPIDAVRQVAAEYALENADDVGPSEQPTSTDADDTIVMEQDVTARLMSPDYPDGQEQYGVELEIDQAGSQAGPSKLDLDGDEDDFDLDLDLNAFGRSASVQSHRRTGSGGGSPRKEVPDQFFDGYKPLRVRGRSIRPGPPGMDEASTRESSVQDAESTESHDMEDDEPEESTAKMPKRGRTTSGRPHESDGSSSDDAVVVTSVRVGAPPAKSREEREAEIAERRRLRIEKEERARKRRESNAVPTFKHTFEQEAAELKLAYEAYLSDLAKAKKTAGSSINNTIDLDAETETANSLPDLATIAGENASWVRMFSYESLKGEHNRPDYNTVKFWPYNLPFPGRRKNEAIVVVAGGCVVRVFRLSQERGVTELWNAVDESVGWEAEALRENFYTCAWTHDVRRSSTIAQQWRKWPLLCVAGKGMEIKILDGYSGATLKVIQGHGGPIYSLAVHPSLPHVIATASKDEAISIWDISVPAAKPQAEAGHSRLEEADKRRKGYVRGERLCVFGGYAGHVEAILSIAIHPSLPLLLSGGSDCKLRIWRLPNLPPRPTSSITEPTAIKPPEKSSKPPFCAFPIFTQTSLHSHHIDHVEWIGHDGHMLTRSLCYDAPGKRVIRLLRPKFFDTFKSPLSKPRDVVGFRVDFPSQVELLARWTTPSSSGGIGDGVVCSTSELVAGHDGKLTTRRRVYVPSIDPAVHIYDLDLGKKQPDLENLVHQYPFKLGNEMLFGDDKGKKTALKAVDCQNAGRGWLVGVGETEKITVWHRKENTEWMEAQRGLLQLIRTSTSSDEQESPSPQPMVSGIPSPTAQPQKNDLYDAQAADSRSGDRSPTAPAADAHAHADVVENTVDPQSHSVAANAVTDQVGDFGVDAEMVSRSPSVEYVTY